MGLGTEQLQRRQHHPRAAGRPRREEQRAGRQRDQGRPARRRDRPGLHPAAQGRPDARRERRGRAARARRWRASPGCGRRSPRRARSPPPTRSSSATALRGDRHVASQGAEARGVTPLGEVIGYGMVAGPDTPRCCTSRAGRSTGRWSGPGIELVRRRPVRDQRGLRRGRRRLDRRAGDHRRDRQRQRRGDRARSPDRHERQPHRAHHPPRTAPPRRRDGRSRRCAAAAARATRRSCARSESPHGPAFFSENYETLQSARVALSAPLHYAV